MSQRARRTRAALAGLLALLVPLRAHARPPQPRPAAALAACGAGQAPLEVVFVPPPSLPASRPPDAAVLRTLRDAVCAWFQDDRWSVSFSQQATLPEPGARGLRLSLELRPGPERRSVDAARLHIDGARGRSVHDVPLASGLDDAGIEAIAEALHSTVQATSIEPHDSATAATIAPASADAPTPRDRASAPDPASRAASTAPSVEALAAGDEAARDEAARDEAARDMAARDEAARDEARPAPTRGDPFILNTALGYQAHARGAEPFMHGPALHVELDVLPRPIALAGSLRASLFTSGTRRSSGFAVRSSGVSLSLGAAARVSSDGVGLRAAAASGVDLVALDVRVIEPTRARTLPDRRVAPRPFSSLEAGVHYRLGPLELALDALLRLLWFETRYQVRDGAQTLTVFSPWQLQPGAVLELGYVW